MLSTILVDPTSGEPPGCATWQLTMYREEPAVSFPGLGLVGDLLRDGEEPFSDSVFEPLPIFTLVIHMSLISVPHADVHLYGYGCGYLAGGPLELDGYELELLSLHINGEPVPVHTPPSPKTLKRPTFRVQPRFRVRDGLSPPHQPCCTSEQE